MPVVSAESVPRPEAPGPISPQVPQDYYQNIPSSAESFGALPAHSMSALGAAAREAGGAGFDIGIMRQELHNNVVSDNQINNYTDHLTQAETNFYALHGEEATKGYQPFRDDLINTRNEMRGQLQNPMQQLEFDRQTRRLQSLTLGRAGIHYDEQYDAYQKATNDTAYQLNKQGVGTAAATNDDDAWTQHVAGMLDAKMKDLQQRGLAGDPNEIWRAQGQVRADATEEKAKALGAHDAVSAAQYIEQNKDVLGGKYPTLATEFREKSIEQVARGAASQGVGGAAAPGGEVQGPAVVPYKAGDILTSTGMSQADYDKYRQRMGDRESAGSGEYNALNAGGYAGRYQMGANERAAAAARLGIPVPTTDEFRKNPALQERMFEAYTDSNNTQMMKIPAYANASPQQKAALLAGAHLTGPDNMRAYLESGQQKADSNGTTPSQYITMIARTMGIAPPLYGSAALKTPAAGTQVAAAAPTTTTDVPPGAPAAAPATVADARALTAPGTATPGGPAALELYRKGGGTVASPVAAPAPAPAAPLPQSTIDTLKAGGMSDAEIARVQGATSGTAAAPSPGAAPAPGTPSIPPPQPAPPAPRTLEQIEADTRANATAAAARAGFDPDATQKTIDLALSHARTQYNNSAAATRAADRNNLTLAQAQVLAGNNGEPFHDLPSYLADDTRRQLYLSLKPADQKSLQGWIEHQATHVPLTEERMQRYAQLDGMAKTAPDEFLKIDPLKEDLPLNMQKQLSTMRNNILKGMQTPPDTTKVMANLTNWGLLQGTGISKTDNPPRYYAYFSALDDALNEFKQKNARLPNTEEQRQIGSDLLQVAIPGGWFSSDTRQYEINVPAAERDAIVRAYQAKTGQTPRPNEILRIYHAKQQQKLEAGETPEGRAPLPSREPQGAESAF